MRSFFFEDWHGPLSAEEVAKIENLQRTFTSRGIDARLFYRTSRVADRGHVPTTPIRLLFSQPSLGEGISPALVLLTETTLQNAAPRLRQHDSVILTGNTRSPLVLTSAAKWAEQLRPYFNAELAKQLQPFSHPMDAVAPRLLRRDL